MQLALLSDIHGNHEALEAVLTDIARRAPAADIVCAGDIVGYGPDPEACLERLWAIGTSAVAGNHEEMVLGRRGLRECVYAGIRAALWTRSTLSTSARQTLAALPNVIEPAPGVVVCHGDLDDANHYVSTAPRARTAMAQLRRAHPDARLLVCGHTHRPALFSDRDGFVLLDSQTRIALPTHGAALVNPGSVGQARHGRALARYALLDVDNAHIEYLAVEYDYDATLKKMRTRRLVAQVVMSQPKQFRKHIDGVRTRILLTLLRLQNENACSVRKE